MNMTGCLSPGVQKREASKQAQAFMMVCQDKKHPGKDAPLRELPHSSTAAECINATRNQGSNTGP